MRINNLPEYANEYEYVVASVVDREYWFYGAYDDEDKAYQVALDIDGVVIKR